MCILGRATTLGRPLAMLLSQKRPTANAAVTVVHTGVPDWPRYTQRAEIAVSGQIPRAAARCAGLLHPDPRKPGSGVIGGGVPYEGRRLVSALVEGCQNRAGIA